MAVASLAAGLPVAAQAPALAASAGDGGPTSVIVIAAGGAQDAARDVRDVGGTVGRELDIIGGVSATVPSDAVATLDALPGVSVSADERVKPMSIDPVLGFDAVADQGSMSAVSQMVGAQALWNAGYTGKGVDVALIDTGVASVPGTGTTVKGPDLSFDYQSGAPAGVDAYGHGTHMAGIINGRDPGATASSTGCTTCLGTSGYTDTSKFVGMAPGARVVNVKVGAYDGSTDVSQVIAAIDWVAKHRQDGDLNIKIINLSFGTNSTNPYTTDPLAFAAEVAWRKTGLLVVASGGNDGASTTQLASPAYDPYLLAVGADDPMGTPIRSDDIVPDFATHGSDARPVDVIAPGVHMISLRVPNSFIDTTYGDTGRVGDRFFRGSGTSQSAAVVSGLAALLYERFPGVTNEQMKRLLMQTAYQLPLTVNPNFKGYGVVDGAKAMVTKLPNNGSQSWTRSTGRGSLEASRGGVHVYSGVSELSGEKDIFGRAWDGDRWSNDSSSQNSWNGGLFEGQRWSGDAWNGTSWTDATWTSSTWDGQSWRGSSWEGAYWDGQSWRGTGWVGQSWRDAYWDGQSWRSASWDGQSWRGQSWRAGAWAGQSWRDSMWSGQSWRGPLWSGSTWS